MLAGSGLWSSRSLTRTDADWNVAGNRNVGLVQKYRITQRHRTISVNPQSSTPQMESNQLSPNPTHVRAPHCSEPRQHGPRAQNLYVANAVKPCVNFTLGHSESRVASSLFLHLSTHAVGMMCKSDRWNRPRSCRTRRKRAAAFAAGEEKQKSVSEENEKRRRLHLQAGRADLASTF